MLPGFRFLFVAVVLSVSMLVFGLGAAALLRATHEEFASLPLRQPPEIVFAQQPETPTLALLRVDTAAPPPAADRQDQTEQPAPLDVTAAVPATQPQPAISAAPPEPDKATAEPDQIAALSAAAPAEEKSGTSTIESSTIGTGATSTIEPLAPKAPEQTEAAAAPALPPAVAEEPKAVASVETAIPATRIATLGGPPVVIEPRKPTKILPARVKKKSVKARRVVKRRRIAQRAPPVRPAQQPANPFASPFGG